MPNERALAEARDAENVPTCGKGLAENAVLPALLGELVGSIAGILETHMKALDLSDRNSSQEHAAYRKLAGLHRETAARLKATAEVMAGCRDLPMGRHDEEAMSSPEVLEAFENLIRLENELKALLERRAERNRMILDQMRAAPAAFPGLWGVRYQVKDVQRSIAFYTQTLHFNLDRQNLPAFGQVSINDRKLILSGPGASGSRPMPDGRQQEPGGWNRVVLEVKDLPAWIKELKNQGVRFRNEMEVGPGGRQVQIEDPDGNPIELFEPAGR